ncbi:hypothetical protein SAMD00019534_065290, partial [Acytostelium subglobosum LB1]|uniref:hypothetical protein n=1 Tax=Acytostelium subglobosum LB1 TaxID=1410327 RepID=UPI000644D626
TTTTTMSTHTLTQVIPMNADTFYAITESTEFDQFQIPMMGLNSIELKEEREDDNYISRKVIVKPKTSIPSFLLKFSSGTSEISYVDTQIKSKQKREIIIKTIPPLMSENICIEGVINVEPLDDNTCLKVLRVTLSFSGSLYWISSIIESNIIAELKKSLEQLPNVVNAYKRHMEEKGLPLPVFKPAALKSSYSSGSSEHRINQSSVLGDSGTSTVLTEPMAQL